MDLPANCCPFEIRIEFTADALFRAPSTGRWETIRGVASQLNDW
jgi:hypothetical protein